MLPCLDAIQSALSLCRRHAVDSAEIVHQPLLGRRGKPVEARLILERTLLVRRRHAPVTLQPIS
jgi:hypothetical protein